jgi:hypothetical protein
MVLLVSLESLRERRELGNKGAEHFSIALVLNDHIILYTRP